MPVTFKTAEVKYKDPDSGTYKSVNAVAESSIADQISDIEAAGAHTISQVQQAVSDSQAAINTLEAQKSTIVQSIASLAQLSTDVTLSTLGMAADAKVTGDINNALYSNFAEQHIKIPVEISSGYVQISDGEINTSSTSSSHTNFVNITAFDSIKYKRRGTTNSTSSAGVAFYDANQDFIEESGIGDATSQEQSGYLSELQFIVPPLNAAYVRFTTFTNTNTYGEFEVYGLSRIASDVIETKNVVENVNNVLQVNDLTEINWFKEQDCAIKYADGQEIPSNVFSATNYIDVRAFNTITYKQLVLGTTSINTGIAFYDSTKTFIAGSGIPSVSGSSTGGEVRDNTVDVPEGACFVRCTIFKNSAGREFAISGKSKLAGVYDILQEAKDSSKTSDSWIKNEKDIEVPFEIGSGYAVDSKTGDLTASSVYGYTDFIDVRPYSRIRYKRIGLRSGASTTTGIALYDANKNFLYGIPSAPIGQANDPGYYFDEYISIDSNVVYVRATVFDNVDEHGQFEIHADANNIDHSFDVEIEPICPFISLGRINVGTGNVDSTSLFVVSDFIPCHGFDFVKYHRIFIVSSNITYGMAFYDEDSNFIYAGRYCGYADENSRHAEVEKVPIPQSAYYVRFTYYNQDNIELYSFPNFNVSLIKNGTINDRVRGIDGKGESATGLYPYKPKNDGIANVIKRAHQLSRIKWTPVGDVTRQMKHLNGTINGNARFKAGVEYVGIPYAVSRDRKNNINNEISVDQFMSIVRNPKTKIYDPDLNTNYAYYGIVCSAFAFSSYGIKAAPITAVMPEFRDFIKVAEHGTFDEYTLELGDMFLKPADHAALVTGILVDSEGVIKYIEISEATLFGYIQGGRVLSKWWQPSVILARYSDYDLYKYKYVNDVKYFGSNNSQIEMEQACYINSDRDCYPIWGDDCRLWVSDTSTADIAISDSAYSDGYRTLVVFKDGEPYNTYSITSSTELVNVPRSEGGRYRAYLTKENNDKSKPIRWVVYSGTFSKVVSGTTLTLTYSTEHAIYGINYNYSGNRYFSMCDARTGEGTVDFEIQEGASSFEVIVGEDEHAVHHSI